MNAIAGIYGYQSVRFEELANDLRVLLKPTFQRQASLMCFTECELAAVVTPASASPSL